MIFFLLFIVFGLITTMAITWTLRLSAMRVLCLTGLQPSFDTGIWGSHQFHFCLGNVLMPFHGHNLNFGMASDGLCNRLFCYCSTKSSCLHCCATLLSSLFTLGLMVCPKCKVWFSGKTSAVENVLMLWVRVVFWMRSLGLVLGRGRTCRMTAVTGALPWILSLPLLKDWEPCLQYILSWLSLQWFVLLVIRRHEPQRLTKIFLGFGRLRCLSLLISFCMILAQHICVSTSNISSESFRHFAIDSNFHIGSSPVIDLSSWEVRRSTQRPFFCYFGLKKEAKGRLSFCYPTGFLNAFKSVELVDRLILHKVGLKACRVGEADHPGPTSNSCSHAVNCCHY